jgi:hypothetical protein
VPFPSMWKPVRWVILEVYWCVGVLGRHVFSMLIVEVRLGLELPFLRSCLM